MDARLIFGLSTLGSLVGFIVFAKFYVWPWLRAKDGNEALGILVAPHLFLRFIGLSFLVVGVVSPSLPAAFAISAAYGDLVAGVLAFGAVIALASGVSWARALVWVFNLWGAADLLFAILQGVRSGLLPGELGAAYFLPTAIVPFLLVTHFLLFLILIGIGKAKVMPEIARALH